MMPSSPMRDERGVALPIALFTLVILSALLLTFLAVGGTESLVSKNQQDIAQARAVAEAGLERAFRTLATSANWTPLLTGAMGAGWVTLLDTQSLPGLDNAFGTFRVQIRNDFQATDNTITGETVDTAGGLTSDTNGVLIARSTGTVNGVTRTIQVVYNRPRALPMQAPQQCAGVRCTTDYGFRPDQYDTPSHVHSDGRDYDKDGNSGAGPLTFGHLMPNASWRTGAIDDMKRCCEQPGPPPYKDEHQLQELDGRDNTKPCCVPILRWNYEGRNTMATIDELSLADQLTPQKIADFVRRVKANPATIILQSNKDAPKVLTNATLGTPSNPKTYYIDAALAGDYVGLTLRGNTTGAGLLIINNHGLTIDHNVLANPAQRLLYRGLIIVTGQNSGIEFKTNTHSIVYGAAVVNETLATSTKVQIKLGVNRHGTSEEDAAQKWQFTGFYMSQETLDWTNPRAGGDRLLRMYRYTDI